MFGEVELTRRYYHCDQGGQGGAGIVPMDMQGKRYVMPEVVEKGSRVLSKFMRMLIYHGDLGQTPVPS